MDYIEEDMNMDQTQYDEPASPYLIGPRELFLYEDEYDSFLIGPYETNGGSLVIPPNAIGITLDKENTHYYIRLAKGLKAGLYSIQLGHLDPIDGKHVYLVLNIYVEVFPYYKYYVQIDERQRVINFGSTGPHNQPGYFDSDEWKLLTDKGKNYQFTFEGEENPYNKFFNNNGVPLWKWSYDKNLMVLRSTEEVQEDEFPPTPQITDKQRLEALELAMLEVILSGNFYSAPS